MDKEHPLDREQGKAVSGFNQAHNPNQPEKTMVEKEQPVAKHPPPTLKGAQTVQAQKHQAGLSNDAKLAQSKNARAMKKFNAARGTGHNAGKGVQSKDGKNNDPNRGPDDGRG